MSSTALSSGNSVLPTSTRIIAVILGAAIFMEQIDSTVLATAIPTMARSFGVPALNLSVAVTSYLLSLSVFIPVSGRIADRFGSRTVLRLAVCLFTLGSILCGISQSVWFLVVARTLQGLGGAMMVPVGRLVLIRAVPKSEFVAMMSWVLVPAMLGPVVGPPLGGLIVSTLSWRWIFYLNVPLGLAGIVLTSLYIPEVKEDHAARFDMSGALLSGIALSTLIAGLELSRDAAWRIWSAPMLLTALTTGLIYARHALAHPSPILDLRLFRIRTFSVAATGGLMFRISFGALPFLMPLMMQLGFGLGPLQSGLITFTGAIGSIAMKATAKPIFARFGYRNLLIWNTLICSGYVAVCAAFRPYWPLPLIYAVLLAGGTFRSIQFTAYGTLAYADVPPHMTGAAVAFHSTVQQMSVTLGVAISAGVLSLAMTLAGHTVPQLSDFSIAFLTIGTLSLASLPLCLTLDPNAGAEMAGRNRKAG